MTCTSCSVKWESLLAFFLLKHYNLQAACRCPQMAGFGKRGQVGGPLLPIHMDIYIRQWLYDLLLKWMEVL